MTSPSEGRKTRGPENNKDTEGWGETPKGRPLPTLREVHQMNLRRALEEEMADVPCDICGSQDHDYHHCQAGALLESQMPRTPNQARTTIEGISARALVAGARRKGTYPWSVPQNSIANQ